MKFKEQLQTIKENWLIAVLLALVLIIPFCSGGFSNFVGTSFSGMGPTSDYANGGGYLAESAPMSKSMGYYPSSNSDFAPEVKERKITKSASLSSEVEAGNFKSGETQIKAIVQSSDSYLLSENVYKSGTDKHQYYNGNYEIKVAANKYDSVVAQLKEIGEVQSFSENAEDVTGTYTDLKTELEVEKARLERYQQMYKEATVITDKIDLNDRIFNQERTIKYYEDALSNVNTQVEYSSIQVTLTEKRSAYADISFVNFSELIGVFVGSAASVLYLIFVVIPFLLLGLIVWLIVKLIRKKSSKK